MAWRGAALAVALLAAGSSFGQAETVAVDAAPIAAFAPRDPEESVFGALRFLGGLVLTAGVTRFGGYSGLEISPDGERIVMVSDVGTFLAARLERVDGRLAGFADVRIAPLRGPAGNVLSGKSESDAEAVRALTGIGPGDEIVVAFEREDRILRYRLDDDGLPGAGTEVARFDLPENKGIESLAVLGPETLVAIAERPHDGSGQIAGWLLGDGTRQRFAVAHTDGYDITDAVALSDGRLVLLERRLNFLGLSVRLRLVDAGTIVPGAVLDGETLMTASWAYEIDNLEGIAVHEQAGRTVLTLVSDDNFSFIQRTVLLEFELLR